MKKSISLVIVLVLVISSFSIVFADSNMTAGEELKSLGLVQGDTNGDLMEDQVLTRAQMMVMLARLNGVESEAKSLTIPSSFSDDDNHWAESYIAYAEYQSWTDGVGNNKFDPEGIVTEQMVATFMLRVLGYDPNWTTAIEDARALGIVNSNQSGQFVRANAFEMMLDTVKTPKINSQVALGVTLGVMEEETDEDVINDTEPSQTVDKDAIASAQALNDRKLKITFGQAVEDLNITKDQIEYTIDGKTNSASFVYEDPNDSKAVITVEEEDSFNRLSNTDVGKVTVNNPELDASKNSLDFGLSSTDAEPIKIEGLQAINNRTVKVYFNQYVEDINLSYFELEGKTFDDKIAPSKDKSIWELSFDSDVMGTGTLDFIVTGTDAARTHTINYSSEKEDMVLEMAGTKDKAVGITDIGIYMTDAKTIEVKFYEPIDEDTLTTSNFTVDQGTSDELTPTLVTYDSDSYIATLTFDQEIDTDNSREHTMTFSQSITDDNGVNTVNDDGEILEMLFAGSIKTPVKVQIEKLTASSVDNTVTMTLDEAIDESYTKDDIRSDFNLIIDDASVDPTTISINYSAGTITYTVTSIEKNVIAEVVANESDKIIGKYSQEPIDPDAEYATIAK